MIEEHKQNRLMFFYTLKTMSYKSDKFYKIYVKDNFIFAAKIAGQIFDEESAYAQFKLMAFLPWIKRKIKKRYLLEKEYDDSQFEISDFLAKDKENFVIDLMSIRKVYISTKYRLWTLGYPNQGTITIETKQNEKIKFIIIGNQDIRYINMIFSNLEIFVEVKKTKCGY